MKTSETTVDHDIAKADWSEFRRQMPVSDRWAYFDHAAVAPISNPAREAISQWSVEAANEGDTVWASWSDQQEQLRSLIADVINASPNEIALVPNTTFGVNLVAEGIAWQPGDNVVMPAAEFPTNVYPWMNLESRGVELRVVELDGGCVCADRIASACDDRTRIVTASWVGYASGYRLDPAELAAVAHDSGALFFLDAIQGLGVFPLDVAQSQVDFLAADGHKWLLGPEGAGVFFARKEHLARLRPLNVGWNSVKQGHDFSNIDLQIRDSASRYEGGSQNLVGLIGLLASLRLLTEFGLGSSKSAVGNRVLGTTDRVCDALDSIGAEVRSIRDPNASSGIVSFTVPGLSSEVLRAHLLDQGVVVSCRGGGLRASAHCYNNDDDLDRLIESIKGCPAGAKH